MAYGRGDVGLSPAVFQSLFSWNLLLMPGAPDPNRPDTRCVSILVFVELALDVRYWRYGRRGPGVSILVFVELALDVLEGSGVGSTILFQSLFSWNLLLMLGGAAKATSDGTMFQSLFSWNLLLMREVMR